VNFVLLVAYTLTVNVLSVRSTPSARVERPSCKEVTLAWIRTFVAESATISDEWADLLTFVET
jgi:hypothetical protein